jgi:hypothetical protein
MLNRRAALFLGLLGLIVAFGYGLVHLFRLRFAAGDVYPAYSSFRSDPVGCRVYFESLQQLGAVKVRRHIQSIEKLPEGSGATLLVFGLPWSEMSAQADEYKILDRFVRQGGRLIVTLYPELSKPRGFSAGLGTNQPAFKNPLQAEDDPSHPPVNLREKWKFGYDYIATSREGTLFSPVLASRVDPAPLPKTVSWHSALVFTNLDDSWRVIYGRTNGPVMIEREQGRGSIVIATDSFFVSNEAMRKERNSDLLAWLAGDNREILFEETHLGVQEKPGIATLARRYKLHGGVIALIGLALLFIWKNSVSFVPPADDSKTLVPVLGRESAAGFQNLLRRSIPPRDLLQTSLDEWHKSARLDGRQSAPRREKIRAIVAAHNAVEKPDAVATYREISRILNRKK